MKKKLIKTFGFIILSNVPLMTMATSSSATSSSEALISRINQTFKTKLRTKFVNNWVTETKRSSNSNIIDGQEGVIFEDSRGNLWAMGNGTKLQKYDYSTNRWTEDNTSSITNGYGGIIFEDSRGNLWSMGFGTSLQKYDYSDESWSDSDESNITDGREGVIFEDSQGNLWAMGSETSLQKYDYSDESWSDSDESNITDGREGVIFEDSQGNLWAMGNGTSLQKYDYSDESWSDSDESNIIDGERGVIFEDSRGNLWAMGNGTSLQKYDYSDESWSDSDESNITDGQGGVIFEDSQGNLWAMGSGTSLQKYDYSDESWSDSDESNIINGSEGVIFEDSQGNLWAMGNGTPLQKYDYSDESWSDSDEINIIDGEEVMLEREVIFEDSRGNLWAMGYGTPLQKYDYSDESWSDSDESNIIDGQGGVIFEDSQGNLWAMGSGTKLQKLTSQNVSNISDQKTKNFDITFTTRINADGRIAVLIKGYRKYTSDKFTHLQYKKKNETNWKIVKDKIMILDKSDYEFKWVIGTDERIASDSKTPKPFEIKNGVLSAEIIITTINLKKELFYFTRFNDKVTIKTKANDLPPQVEPRYYVGSKSNPDDSDYTNLVSPKLSNDDIVKIKFFIKNKYINTHQFPDDFKNMSIKITIADLQERIFVATTNLKKELFYFTNFNDQTTIKTKTNDLPAQVEPRYYVGPETNPNEKEYTINISAKLSIYDTVEIKFFIKNKYINTHQFPDDFKNTPIEIIIVDLQERFLFYTASLKKEKFSVTGFNGSGTIQLKKDVALAPQTELRYYVGSKSNPDDSDYTSGAQTKLSNDNIVKIKLFIKNEYINTHQFLDDFANTPITITVTGLKKNDIATANLKKEKFSVTGFNGSGTIQLKKDVALAPQTELRYYVGSKSNPDDSDYTSSAQTKLSNDNIVKIKLFIKNEYINTHQFLDDFANTPIEITVADLPEGTPVVITNLKKESFFITGLNGIGTIKLKKGITLSPQVEAKYYIGKNLNPNDSDYTNTVPNKLSNGKKVWIKFFIKNENINTHKFPNNFANTPIKIKVSGLNNKSSNKESSGATIGIIVGSIVGTLILGILVYYLIRSKKKKIK